MTTVTFHTEGNRIIGFDSFGHSGYAEAGEDIVCAAITSAIRLVDATINDVMGLAASVKVKEEEALISLRLPGGLAPTAESTCQSLLTGLMVYFAQLHDEYPENIEVLEED
ncbi:MAG: ribosomal-processing cysteine protease Prp [Oscillibacter sp.]|nr:ribosomal-processing cysteine protease Prp [Oscillibacter sp.]MBQ2996168.1 ribosomal-processing cysteine protease Prp [Oscillibacter sp.]